MHWFANHMPIVIKSQHDAAAAGLRAPLHRDIVRRQRQRRTSVGWHRPALVGSSVAEAETPTGTTPRDSFQQKAEPYVGWATTEYVVIDGAEHLPVQPLTLNAPFPCTRSGFFKMTFLVKAKPDTVFADLFDHWLNVHVPNVEGVMHRIGGLRYVVSHSIDPQNEPYAGMAELYFTDASGWTRYRETVQSDGMEQLIDQNATLALLGQTEMIGIP
jgi:hypothetical protein